MSHQQNPGLPHAAQLSAFYHSAHTPLARRGSSTSDNSASHYSPASSTHRGASQLLRLESRASDPFSNPVSSRQGSMTLPDAQFGAQLPSLAQARVRRDSVASQTSSECQHQSESSRHELDIVRLGSSGGSGGGGDQSWRGSGGPAILDRVSLSVLQVRPVLLLLHLTCTRSRGTCFVLKLVSSLRTFMMALCTGGGSCCHSSSSHAAQSEPQELAAGSGAYFCRIPG